MCGPHRLTLHRGSVSHGTFGSSTRTSMFSRCKINKRSVASRTNPSSEMLLRTNASYFATVLPSGAGDGDSSLPSQSARLNRGLTSFPSSWVVCAVGNSAFQAMQLLEPDVHIDKDTPNSPQSTSERKFMQTPSQVQDTMNAPPIECVHERSEDLSKVLPGPKLEQISKPESIKTRLPQSRSVVKQHNARWIPKGEYSPKVEEILKLLKEACFTSCSLEEVMENHWAQISKYDVFCILTVLQQQHDWQRSLEIFQLIKRQCWYIPNARVYARMMSFLGKEGQPDLATNLFQEMLLEKCKPTQYTLTALVNAYGKAKMFNEANDVFEYMKTSGDLDCKPNVVACNALMDGLVKGGRHDQAVQMFIDMREARNGLDSNCRPNAVTYNIFIESLCKEGLIDKAVQLLHQTIRGDFDQELVLNVSAYNVVITACGRAGLPFKAEELMEDMVVKGLEPDKITYTGLIDAYGKAGLYENAENAFQGMRAANIDVDVMAYTAMLNAYASEGLYEKADGLFKFMQQAGVQPNHVTYCALIDAYGKSGLPDEAHNVFLEMQRAGYKGNAYIYSALIDAYGKSGKYVEAADIFRTMKLTSVKPNLVVYAALMSACRKCKSWKDASLILDCLCHSGRREELAMCRLLSASADEPELWKNALKMFKEFQEHSKLARLSFYNALADVLWSFGLQKRASKVLSIGKEYGVYPDEMCIYSQSEWCLDLHALSVGAAMVSLISWLNELHAAWLWGEGVPDMIRIITGKGKHSRSKKSALKIPILSKFIELNAPFTTMETNTGSLAAPGNMVREWVFSVGTKQRLVLTDKES